jgi:lactoylglutathione lyase
MFERAQKNFNGEEELLAKSIHSMIRVVDEARSVSFYEKAFNLSVADRLDFDSFTLVYMSNAETEFELELTINKGRSEPYDLGDGYGHLAVSVDNLDEEHARFEREGLNPRKLVEFERDGALLARFFFVQDPDGYEIEVLQRHGRFK